MILNCQGLEETEDRAFVYSDGLPGNLVSDGVVFVTFGRSLSRQRFVCSSGISAIPVGNVGMNDALEHQGSPTEACEGSERTLLRRIEVYSPESLSRVAKFSAQARLHHSHTRRLGLWY